MGRTDEAGMVEQMRELLIDRLGHESGESGDASLRLVPWPSSDSRDTPRLSGGDES